MPKVKFLQDFQGKETGEVFYKAGQVADLSDYGATLVVKDGRAEFVQEAPASHYGGQIEPELKPRNDEEIYKQVAKEEPASVFEAEPVVDVFDITEEEVKAVPPTPKKRGRK
jgi:hypothetical protein